MKLKKHFEQVSKLSLDEESKSRIFVKIVDGIQSEQKGGLRVLSPSFALRVVVYSIFMVLAFYSFYGVNNNFLPQQKSPYVAQAQSLGKVVELKGDFKIIRGGKPVETLRLKDNDVLILGEDSKIKFNINS